MAFTTGTILDTMGDQDALTLDITVNLNLISVVATRLPYKIYDIVGPIEGRWLYFTTDTMYPSDVNDPDLVDVSIGVKLCNSASEIFLWARAVSDSIVLVATSVDMYMLSGTFATLPDESVDIYYRPLHCKYPAITSDVAVMSGTVFYLSNDGWRSFSVGGANPSLTAPNTDRLYRGEAAYGYTAPDIKFLPGTQRFPITIQDNKLWCCVTGTNRYEVFDFTRNYWRPVETGLGDITAIFSTPDGRVLAFFGTARTTHQLEMPTSKATSYSILTMVGDGDAPQQRKNPHTLSMRCNMGVPQISGCNVTIYAEDGSSASFTNKFPVSSPTYALLSDMVFDIETVANSRNFQLLIEGATPDFVLSDIYLDSTIRTLLLTSYRQFNSNFGSASKKRLRVWPFAIDTLGGSVQFLFYVDGVLTPVANDTVINSNSGPGGLTYRVYITSDVFGVDYGFLLKSLDVDENGNEIPFELYDVLPPEIVQVLPIAKRFDQVGPAEMFKYGKIKQLELRILPDGGAVNTTSALPWRVYMNDNSVQTGSLTVANAVEASYYIGMRKGIAGQIVRIELGPTSYDFHRYYMRAQILPSGGETDNQWVTLAGAQ